MADNYISTNMESGVKVKEALERIESYEPGLFVWTEVSDSVTVNLKSPTTYSGIKDPGDYVIYKFSNGPAKIPSTLAPVLLSLRNGEICVTANNMVFMLNGDNWVDMSESIDTDTTIFVKSDIAPVRTKNCYWFDTSKYTTEGYITLKYYDTDTSTWKSVFNEERYLKKSELDPDNKNTDVYDYITTKVAGVVGEYGEFMKHVANQLTYIHVSADDRKAYGKIITKDQLQTLLEKTYTPAVKTVIDQTVSDGLGTTALENSLTTLKDNITSHLEGHVTAEDITRWKNKAEKNHTHDYTQGNTKLDASQIASGTFGEDQLPDEIKERYYKITAASPAAEFSSSSITAAMRKGKYHNGNGFYFETTDSETGKVTRQWYRIIDSSKVGTSNWAQGVVDFTATEVNLDWNQISGKPSSLEEFGITTDLYTKTEIDEKFSSYDSNITELNKDLESANEEVSYEFGVKDCPVDLDSLSVGSTFTLGKYQVESEDPWDIEWEIVHQTDDYQIAMTKQIIDLRTFDAIEANNTNSDRSKKGNNNWSVSNIEQFLNSDQASWYSAQHTYDAPPSSANCWHYSNGTTYNAYDTHKGFLYYWSDSDKSILKDMTLTLANNTVTDGGGSYTWTGKVWLPTYTQMGGGQNNSISEGTKFSKFTNDSSKQKTIHEKCLTNNEYCEIDGYTSSSTIYYWMSSALTSKSQYTRYISPSGYTTGSSEAYNGENGIAPCICLPRSFSQLYGKIDRIGLQIRKDSTTFSDNATGSIPQIDAIIKTTDGKIYKATQNLNSTYTDYNGNKTTTTNAAEPVGASMCEKFMKEYEWRNTDNLYYSDLAYGNNIYVCNVIKDDKNQIMYSKNGKSWNTATGTNLTGIVYSINFCNNIFIATTLGYQYAYSTDGINWTQKAINENYHFITNIHYANGKYVAFIENNEGMYNTYSTDLINWTIGSKITMSIDTLMHNALNSGTGVVNKIAYGNTKFISVGIGPSNSSNMLYSTDGINWTEGMISSFPYNWRDIKYINGKFYALGYSDYNNSPYKVIAYSTNGINWTIPILKWSDNTEININSGSFDFCKFDDTSLIGYFFNNSWDDIVLAKSTDGITWTKIYSLGTDQIPNGIVYTKDGVVMTSDNLSGSIIISYLKLLHYSWTVNAKSGQTFAANNINDDTYAVLNVDNNFTDTVTVDTTYDANSIDKHPTGAYRFSGWSQTGNITFTKDTPRVTEITGTWNWVDMVKYSYSWNAPSYSDLTGLVTLPTGGSAYAGETVSVDTKYNSDSKVEVLNWTQGTLPSSQKWNRITYGNGKFVAVAGGSYYDKYIYSTDGVTWTEGSMPSSQAWNSVCYGNGKFVAAAYAIFAYSTDGITWTKGTMPSRQTYYICYSNDKFIASTYSTSFAYSTDGINWTEGTLPIDLTSANNNICYGAGKFVSIAYRSNEFAYSTDGITWVKGTLPTSNKGWVAVCYGNGKFVAVNDKTPNSIVVSSDGINWVEINNLTGFQMNYIYYGSGLFIIIPRNIARNILYSIDGINWTQGTLPSNKTNYCHGCYGNGKFVILNNYNYTDTFYYCTLPTSYYQFSGWNPSTDFIINENKTISGTWSKKNKLRVSYSWSNQPRGMKSKVPSDEYYHYGDNVMVDTTYNNKSGYKEEKWESSSTISITNNPNSICYGNGKFVAIGEYGTDAVYNAYVYSTDGINWTEGTLPSSQHWHYVCYGNSKFVAVVANSDKFAYSTDGINWTQGTMPSEQTWYSICYGNGKFVAIAWFSNIFAYSTDGITWTQGTMPSNHRWTSVCYGNGKFVAIPSGNTDVFAYSTDGITWTEGTLPVTDDWGNVYYCNDKFVAVLKFSNVFAYSSNGTTWTEGTLPVKDRVTGAIYASNKYILVSYNGNYLYSTDCINWNYSSDELLNGAISLCYGNNKIVATRTGATTFAYFSPTYYQFSGWNKSDFNITADTSVSGSWSQVSAGGGTNLSELSVGDTFFLGKYQVESETPWDIEWEIVHQTADYQVAMTKQVIDLMPFDGKEPTNTDIDRKSYGNNNWQYSNIEQWMNSDQASWYSAQHQYDAPPSSANCWQYSNGTTYNAYDNHKGFLYYWSADEKALLKDMTLTLANNTVTDGGGSYTWTGKVWLPTYTQMGGGQNNSISEGEAFSKFTDNTSRVKSLHPNCAANNEYCKINNYASGKTHWYWMSSALPSYSNFVRNVDIDGSFGNDNDAYNGDYGFAPCICLPRTGWSDPNKAPDLNYIT